MDEKVQSRISKLLKHLDVPNKSQDEDELEELLTKAEEIEQKDVKKDEIKEVLKFTPYLIVPTHVEESERAGNENRERRRKRVKILYDVHTSRAQTPAFLDVSQDDPKTPLAFRYIRIILLTATARKAQDIHLDQYSRTSMSGMLKLA